MLAQGLTLLKARAPNARVLDLGCSANRADRVIDLMPYETRGAMLAEGIGPKPALRCLALGGGRHRSPSHPAYELGLGRQR